MNGALLLVHEPEAACRERLRRDGFGEDEAVEISSYLAQSTDIQADLPALAEACASRELAFRAVELDDAAKALAAADPHTGLVWTLTDGIAYFRGGAAPALARLHGLRTVGSDDSAFALCQDKFRSGAVLGALGLPVPTAGLARNGRWIAPPPRSPRGWFVKPNRLGAKIGIWEDSHCQSEADALALSRRIFERYRDDAIVQAYVPGRNARASYLDAEAGGGTQPLDVRFVDSGGDFQAMADSMALYGETAVAAQAAPMLAEVPAADAETVRSIADRLMAGVGVRDVFSMDLRIEEGGRVHLIEFEVCPGLPCFDFRAYCRGKWAMSLADAMACAAAARLRS